MIALEVYASAYFRASKDPLVSYNQLLTFSKVIENDNEILSIINGNTKAYDTFKDIIESNFNPEFSNLLSVLVQDGRVNEWSRFVNLYREILVDKSLVFDVHVMSARKLLPEDQKDLEIRIKNKYGNQCEFRYDIDSSLIDGIKLVINHQTLDASVRGSLDKIKKEVLQ